MMFTSWEKMVWLKHSGSVVRLEVRRLGHPSWRRWGWAGRRIFGDREEREGHSRLWNGMSCVWAMSEVKDWQVGGRGGVGTGSRHWCLAGSDAVHMEAIAATSWVYSVV